IRHQTPLINTQLQLGVSRCQELPQLFQQFPPPTPVRFEGTCFYAPKMTVQNHLREEILWPAPPLEVTLAGSDVHVWAASLDLPEPTLAKFESLLAPEELERAARFHFRR